MSKKQYNSFKSVTSNFDMSRAEKDLLKGKKVMLPLKEQYNDRLSHSKDVRIVAEKIYDSIKKNYVHNKRNDFYINTLTISKICTIAKWHDVGHCPYGHKGEETLNSLISENDESYWDIFYSGYKHNLLSAKILLDLKINVSWDIIDAVIKHSSVLPKNFNLSRANNSNILKLNYIFNCDRTNIIDSSNGKVAVNKSWYFFMKNFVLNFPCQICRIPKYYFINGKDSNESNIIKICGNPSNEDCKYCVIKADNKNIKNNITQYLLFPYPLTLNGDIVRVADEISAMVRDLEYYSKFLKKNHVNQYQIVFAKVINELNILKSKYVGENKQYDLINLVNDLLSSKISGDVLIDYLVENVDINFDSYEIIELKKFNSVPLIVNWDNAQEKNYCKPLLEFNKDVNELFKKIKKCIYSIIHEDKSIKDDNDIGKEYIKNVFKFYYDNPLEFLKLNDHLNDELNLITDVIRKMEPNNLIDKINFAKAHINEKTDYDKLLNSFRREIAFYIARLTETELKELNRSIQSKTSR